MTQDDLFILAAELGGPYCGLWDVPDEVTQNYPPSVGEPDDNDWPSDPRFAMEKSLPGLVVPDFINNAFGFLMVSEAAKALLVEHAKEPIEWLSFKIVNHKGVTLPDNYWVANVLVKLACVDVAASDCREDALYPGTFDLIRDLHLDYAAIPDDARIFRLSVFPRKILIHRSLKEEIERRGLKGATFAPPTGRVKS
jgi:hypothetical protein